jgi:tetratricopeptide (TPR) repeat protein
MIHAAIGLRRMLIVIDDAWTVDEALAFKIGGPNCASLLTTRLPRVAQDFAGEAALAVHELDDSDGLDLLARYGVAVAEAEARSLVRAAGGLPLALSLMGRYLQRETRAGQPRRLRAALDRLQQIGQRLSLAQSRSPLETQPDVPLSLLAVIASTDDALDPDARATLRSLSIFPAKPNTFGEEAALKVTGALAAALDTLVDSGLLEAAPLGRYTLHQTISEYAAHRLESGLARRAPFVAYFVDFVVAHAGEPGALEIELSNCLTALNIALEDGLRAELARGANALYAFLETRGLHTLIELHLAHAESYARQENDRPGLCDSLGNLARIAHRRGDYAQSETRYREALGLAHALDDPRRVSALLSGLGVLAFSRGDYEQAEAHYAEGLRLARESGDPLRVSALLANMGALALTRGFTPQAETYLYEGLALARALSDRSRAGALLINLGVCAARQGEYERAAACFQESLELARGAGHREQILFLLTNLGTLASDRQDVPRAESYFHEGLALAREMNDRARISHLLANLGTLAVSRRDFVQADALYGEGLRLARAIGHRENITLLLLNAGDMDRARGQLARAEAAYDEGLLLAKEMGHQRYVQAIQQRLESLAADRPVISNRSSVISDQQDRLTDD